MSVFTTTIPAPDKLKPCPFCDSKAIFHTFDTVYGRSKCGFHFGVMCAKCDTRAPSSKVFEFHIALMEDGEIRITRDDRKEAADAWNKRGGKD